MSTITKASKLSEMLQYAAEHRLVDPFRPSKRLDLRLAFQAMGCAITEPFTDASGRCLDIDGWRQLLAAWLEWRNDFIRNCGLPDVEDGLRALHVGELTFDQYQHAWIMLYELMAIELEEMEL